MSEFDGSPSGFDWTILARHAWGARENARVLGAVRVGSALLAEGGGIYAGCNVEHRFRSHDIHAEVNAIGAGVAAGARRILAIIIVSDRSRFTPCGACMDWIIELGGLDCRVAYQRGEGGRIDEYRARELMPHYPVDGGKPDNGKLSET